MALSLAEALREARSIPYFDGQSEYTITHFLRDVSTILSLVSEEGKYTISKVLCNKLKGPAMHVIQQLNDPTFDDILRKLKEEFGVKTTFLNLRNEAMNIRASSIEDLHNKLGVILQQMNTKFSLEGETDILYTPCNNSKLIFEIYLQFLPFNVKTLLLQNQIDNMEKAFTYYLQNNILKDFEINNSITNVHTRPFSKPLKNPPSFNHNFSRNSNDFNHKRNLNDGNQNCGQPFRSYSNNSRNGNMNFSNNQNYRNPDRRNNSGNFNNNIGQNVHGNVSGNYYNKDNSSGNIRGRFNDHGNHRYTNNSGRFNNHTRYNQQSRVVPMEVDNIEKYENFQLSPLQPTYP